MLVFRAKHIARWKTVQAGLQFRNNMSSACIVVIADEVLNGKIVDTNSTFFARYCYGLGIPLKEIVTVGDDEAQIVGTLQRVRKQYDFIVTSGGIGPTHDDITYEAVAKSCGLPVELNAECQERMRRLSNPEARHSAAALRDHYRMATLPVGENVRNYYVADDLWVPVCSIDRQVFVLPGIPQLFERMLRELEPVVRATFWPGAGARAPFRRFFVTTPRMETEASSFLRGLQEEAVRLRKDVKIGSYPHFGMGFNTVSISGSEADEAYLRQLVERTISELDGKEVSEEDERKFSDAR
ncbi:FAFL130Cp [Eremothecium gossypii FDAG1]|nr:FAFL130Cp [Eremothecium gossypii FDAG1]